jgi:hypothetical protein
MRRLRDHAGADRAQHHRRLPRPDILRFGFAALYVRHVDIWDTIAALKDIVTSEAWNTEAFRTRKSVT